uniref:Uncharacterized protein n=1 Tax=Anguilla anguilla TaxID=7936 RepID=A0A0E9UBY7_ANGAN
MYIVAAFLGVKILIVGLTLTLFCCGLVLIEHPDCQEQFCPKHLMLWLGLQNSGNIQGWKLSMGINRNLWELAGNNGNKIEI